MTVVGTRMVRKEDPELLTGEARFIDDLVIPGARWLAMVRSPFAHARITGIDASEALALPGVVAVYTGADLRDEWAGPMPCAWPVTDDMKNPEHFPVAVDKACYVGDIVAVVVADSRYAAADAVGAVVVDYDPLPAVVDLEDALSDRVVIHDDLGTNASYTWALIPDQAAVDAAFADAVHTVKRALPPAAPHPGGHGAPGRVRGARALRRRHHRLLLHPDPPHPQGHAGRHRRHPRAQAPRRRPGGRRRLRLQAQRLRRGAPLPGPGPQAEAPVRWTEERTENAQATIQGRGQIQDIELAADADGKVTAVRVHLLADMGAYLQLVTPGIPLLGAFLYHGVYDVPAYSFTCTSRVHQQDAHRRLPGRRSAPRPPTPSSGPWTPWPAQMGIDPAEIRRRNFIPPDAFPYSSSPGWCSTAATTQPPLAKALELVGYDDREGRPGRRRRRASTGTSASASPPTSRCAAWRRAGCWPR